MRLNGLLDDCARRLSVLILCTMTWVTVACDGTAVDAGPIDAGATDGGSARSDGGGLLDAGPDIIAPADLVVGDVVEATLDGAPVGTVEVVGRYDHNVFWGYPEDKVSVALFSPTLLAPFPQDESIHIVDVLALSDLTPSTAAVRYRDALRAQDVGIARPPLDGPQVVLTGNESYHLDEDGYGHFAWDIVTHDEEGQRYTGNGAANADYNVYGRPIYLPRGGTLIDAIDTLPDNAPGSYPDAENILDIGNNMVGVHLYGNYYLYLLHMIPGSIPDDLVQGAFVEAGTYIGDVGNSGVSLEPHLHLVLYYYDEAAGRSWSVPAEWRDIVLGGMAQDYAVPRTGQTIRSVLSGD